MTKRFALLAPVMLDPWPNGAEAARWPAIETLLARGRRRRLPAFGLIGAIGWLSDSRLVLDETWPAAPISLLGEGLAAADGWWLRADPVHLLPDADRLRLMPAETLGRETRESLVHAFNEHFSPDDYHLEAPHPNRWYLRTPRALHIETHAPETVMGRYVYDYMPTGPDAGLAARLMTEVQMIFHAAAERRGGEPTVNSLWIWGGGELPPGRRVPLPPLWSDEPFPRGIWLLTGNSVRSLPETAAGCLAQHESDGVAALENLDAARLERRDALTRLEQDWCAPLLTALKQKELAGLDLLPGDDTRFELTRAAARRFWRRRKPLASVRHA